MKVFVVKTLVEDIDSNTCNVEVFNTLNDAQKFANDDIDNLAEEFGGNVTERADTYFSAQSGDTYITIEIEEKEIH